MLISMCTVYDGEELARTLCIQIDSDVYSSIYNSKDYDSDADTSSESPIELLRADLHNFIMSIEYDDGIEYVNGMLHLTTDDMFMQTYHTSNSVEDGILNKLDELAIKYNCYIR